jgi:REP element-mobilizing transposase RayT
MGFQPMDPDADVSIRQGAHLPHWTQSGATYAVNFRLVDSLPKKVVTEWESERRDIIFSSRRQKRELTHGEQSQLAKLFSEKIENYLDAGYGKCWLRDDRIARLVRDALLRFESERYSLIAWCIMPNHAHVIVRPKPGNSLSEILHSWKSFTAKEANRLLNRAGAFWQPESYDHLIRTEQDLRNQIRYVVENPQKAGLQNWPWFGGVDLHSHRQDADATKISAPGQLPSHYAPKTPLRVVDDLKSFAPQTNRRCALLAWNWIEKDKRFVAIRNLSERQDLREAAANLFRYLRELDALDVDLIVAERVPLEGLGAAILDRLQRASHV